jgi:hypothetical protein
MKRLTLIVLAIALAGCQTTRTVIVPCVKGELPAEPPKVADKLTGNAERDIGIVAGSALRLRAYGGELRSLLEACR